jgi:hypothetical protein
MAPALDSSQPPGCPPRAAASASRTSARGKPGGRVTALDSPAASRQSVVVVNAVPEEVAFHGRRRL